MQLLHGSRPTAAPFGRLFFIPPLLVHFFIPPPPSPPLAPCPPIPPTCCVRRCAWRWSPGSSSSTSRPSSPKVLLPSCYRVSLFFRPSVAISLVSTLSRSRSPERFVLAFSRAIFDFILMAVHRIESSLRTIWCEGDWHRNKNWRKSTVLQLPLWY